MYGMPVRGMLAHSPLLPLAIDYVDGDCEISPEDEEGILLALQRRCRIRRIRLCIPVSNLQRVILVIGREFPMLEYLHIKPLADDNQRLILPEMFQAPNLCRIVLRNVARSPGIFHHEPLPPTTPVQSVERFGLCAQCYGPKIWRYACLSRHIYQLVN